MKKQKIQLTDEIIEILAGETDEQLLDDYVSSKEDMGWCRAALEAGMQTYGVRPDQSLPPGPGNVPVQHSVLHRLIQDCRIMAVARAELDRRGTINVIDLDWIRKSSDLLL